MPLHKPVNDFETTLSTIDGITDVATSLDLTSVTGLPVTYPYWLTIGDFTIEATEIIEVTGTTGGNQRTVVRGQQDTIAKVWPQTTKVCMYITKGHIEELQTQVNSSVADIDTLEASVNGLQTQANGLQTQADGLQTQADGLQTQADGLQTQVNTSAADIVKLQAVGHSFSRQALINGNFDVWQRGASIASGTALYYSADRWQTFRGSSVVGLTASRQDASLSGSQYCMRVQRNVGVATTNVQYLGQSIETINSILLRGKKLTLSFYARAGANFSGASNVLLAGIMGRTAINEAPNIAFTFVKSLNCVLTTTWQKFTMTTDAVIANDVNTVKVGFQYLPVGTAGANDYFEVTQVQLCVGDIDLPFQPKAFDEELNACQRYYEKSYNYATSIGTIVILNCSVGVGILNNSLHSEVSFKVSKRIAPVVKIYSTGTGALSKVSVYSNQADVATADVISNYIGQDRLGVLTSPSSQFAINTGYSFHWTADAEM